MMLSTNIQVYADQLKLPIFYEELSNQLAKKVEAAEAVEAALLAQVNANNDARVQRLLKAAHLPDLDADINTLPAQYWIRLKKQDVERHANCEWIHHHNNIVAIGPTGSGKTGTACALAKQAIYQGIPVMFYTFNEFTLHLVKAYNEEKIDTFIKKLNRFPLIIIDDWGIQELTDSQRRLLFNFIVDRDKKGSLFITSQKPIDAWHHAFGDPVMADSVVDRISNHSYILDMYTETSLREVFGLQGGKST